MGVCKVSFTDADKQRWKIKPSRNVSKPVATAREISPDLRVFIFFMIGFRAKATRRAGESIERDGPAKGLTSA